mgnify:CR=1 FL=1
MKVTVTGKEYVSGTTKKTGKDFAANVVHVTHKKNGVEGYATDAIWLDPKSYPLADIQVGKVYDVDRDSRGFIVDFELVR